MINVHAEGFNKEDTTFRTASPKGMVPAIIDGDVHMSEAYLINEYLDRKYPQNPLLPKADAECRKIRDWVAVYDKKLTLKIGLLLLEILLKTKEQQNEAVKEKFRVEILAALAEVDEFLKDKDHLFGIYSLADVSMTPHIAALGRVGVELGSRFPRVQAWLSRVKGRPSFEASGVWAAPSETRA